MKIYKIGSGLYKDGNDKNGGMHEFNLIKDALKDIEHVYCDTLVLVNGFILDGEEDIIERLLDEYSNKIFIATDYLVLKEQNLDIANRCDLVLHQSKTIINMIKPEQAYSYVPELFFSKIKSKPFVMRDERVVHGGINRGREHLFNEYIIDRDLVLSFHKLYDEEMNVIEDNRIEYDEFQKQLRKNGFSLILSKSKSEEVNWVTPKFIEIIANGALPILDDDYDKDEHFRTVFVRHLNAPRVMNYTELERTVDYYMQKPELAQNIIDFWKAFFELRTTRFEERIIEYLERGLKNGNV